MTFLYSCAKLDTFLDLLDSGAGFSISAADGDDFEHRRRNHERVRHTFACGERLRNGQGAIRGQMAEIDEPAKADVKKRFGPLPNKI